MARVLKTKEGLYFRINGAFGTFSEWEERIANMKRIQNIPTFVDLPTTRRLKHRTNNYTDDEIFNWCIANKIDYIGVSFVESPEDFFKYKKNGIKICTKIETLRGFVNLEIIKIFADMIMFDFEDLETDINLKLIGDNYVVMK